MSCMIDVYMSLEIPTYLMMYIMFVKSELFYLLCVFPKNLFLQTAFAIPKTSLFLRIMSEN